MGPLGLEPSCPNGDGFTGRLGGHTVNVPVLLERPAGFEPASSPWRGEILPLDDGRAHVEPPVGLEPTTSGLRNRRCCQLSYGGNGRPPGIEPCQPVLETGSPAWDIGACAVSSCSSS